MWFALIRKGSGHVVGLARLVEYGKALDQEEMIAAFGRHRIPERMIRSGVVSKWVVPWKLADVMPIEPAVPYEHKSRAVTWVMLSDQVSSVLAERMSSTKEHGIIASSRTIAQTKRLEAVVEANAQMSDSRLTSAGATAEPPDEGRRVILRKIIKGGSLRNKYVRLGECLSDLPSDTIGGANKASAAPRRLTVHWGGPHPIETDIAGDKQIFRNRSIMRRFIETTSPCEGDVLVLTLSDPYTMHLALERRS